MPVSWSVCWRTIVALLNIIELRGKKRQEAEVYRRVFFPITSIIELHADEKDPATRVVLPMSNLCYKKDSMSGSLLVRRSHWCAAQLWDRICAVLVDCYNVMRE